MAPIFCIVLSLLIYVSVYSFLSSCYKELCWTKPTLELRTSIIKLKTAYFHNLQAKSTAMRDIWASVNVGMTLDEDSWTYLQEQVTSVLASWGWKCHVVRIWRSLVFPAVDLCSLKTTKHKLFLCAEDADFCAFVALWTREQDGACPGSVAAVPVGGSWGSHLQVAAPSCFMGCGARARHPTAIGKLKIKTKSFPPPFKVNILLF